MIKRQQIIDALIARLQGIRQSTPGFYTDIGLHVFDYRTTSFNDNELPAINIKDDVRKKLEDQSGGSQQITDWDLTITIELICKSGGGSMSDLRKCMADVERAIGQDIKFMTVDTPSGL